MQCKCIFTKRFTLSAPQSKRLCYGKSHKNALRWQQQSGMLR